jgi:hypothetical protein
MLQLARLAGLAAFLERFGSPQTAEPKPDALVSFVDEHIEAIARALVGEAAASDDITDRDGALDFLDDRLDTLGDLLTLEQGSRVRDAFREKTKAW